LNTFKLTTPVAFIIFKRADTTKKVFDILRKVKPQKLFIIADGPRNYKSGEDTECNIARKITENIDWQCEVYRNYSEVNMGCKNRIASGIDWLFQNVEEAIIIEDDCLPDISFFRFCQEMLHKYKNNEKVSLISGNKVLFDYYPQDSYYFSKFTHIWGWATWKRTWQKYDINIQDWSANKKSKLLSSILKSNVAEKYWTTILDEVQNGTIDAWSLQLQLTLFKTGGLTIIPSKNLVVNLGFASEHATNTKGSGGLYRRMKLEEIEFPLTHPKLITENSTADELETKTFHKFGFKEKIRRILLKFNIRVR